jgi:hypothetical protein
VEQAGPEVIVKIGVAFLRGAVLPRWGRAEGVMIVGQAMRLTAARRSLPNRARTARIFLPGQLTEFQRAIESVLATD